MTDQAPTLPPISAFDRAFLDLAGRALLLGVDPRPRLERFAVHAGGRRLADRTPGAASLTIIQGDKK
jgi:hypothetical protein